MLKISKHSLRFCSKTFQIVKKCSFYQPVYPINNFTTENNLENELYLKNMGFICQLLIIYFL